MNIEKVNKGEIVYCNIKLEYDEISPLSGRKCVVVEADEETNVESYMCMESGFTTSDKLKIGYNLVDDKDGTTRIVLYDGANTNIKGTIDEFWGS